MTRNAAEHNTQDTCAQVGHPIQSFFLCWCQHNQSLHIWTYGGTDDKPDSVAKDHHMGPFGDRRQYTAEVLGRYSRAFFDRVQMGL